jgi:uncharacterized lipoprotein YmbA
MKITLISLAVVLGLAGCAGSSAPPQYYQLRLDAPVSVPASAPAGTAGVWQVLSPVRMPEYLERDVLWVPTGQAGLQPLPEHRWAEPLADAVPRVLLHDLAVLRGADHVWGGNVPTGVAVNYQLRLEVMELSITPDRRGVHLRARCTASDPRRQAPPKLIDVDLTARSEGSAPDQLVAAHRLALWTLAQQLADRLTPPTGP